ncbi:hypothetical protein AVEN_182831-1 [Araneus ventricosus]|uniref:Uncharacterized protein n=1 Tax=Araneus ventricosus TaxID=182803 RepID=A0A4Y2QI40_ARAVE|nr:hypothetical protein AVEN_114724-1 [Araneus ventricosus]GBN62999.1 hypothetical protein AVEN_182831-1 [Araneus ventricosus]
MGRPISRKKGYSLNGLACQISWPYSISGTLLGGLRPFTRERSLWHRRCDGLIKCHFGRTRHLRIFGRDFVTAVRHRALGALHPHFHVAFWKVRYSLDRLTSDISIPNLAYRAYMGRSWEEN